MQNEIPATGTSPRQILTASAIALAVAGVTLVTVILPAEYSVDPLGTGRVLGLVRDEAQEATSLPTLATSTSDYTPHKVRDASFYRAPFKVEKTEFVLGPYEYIEYKYHMEKGASLVFSWSASARVDQEFHGEPEPNSQKGVVSYEKGIAQAGNGDLVASFTGIHGWYWENREGEPVTIKLASSGFYTSGLELRSDKTRRIHTLNPVPTAANNNRSSK